MRRFVLASVLTLGMVNGAWAQSATNSATVTPPGTVINTGASCVPPNVFNSATGACTATDTDTIVVPVTVTKTLTGAPAGGVDGTYAFTLTCGTNTYNGSVVLGGGALTGQATVNVPVGSTGCTVAETSTPPAPTNYTWGTATYVQPTSPIAAGATATITNPLSANPGTLTITKTITGGTSATALSFPYTVTCATPSNTYTGNVTVAAGASNGTATVNNIPAGSTCTVAEGTLPPPPSNYSWGTPTYTQPSGAMAPGGTQTATIANSLARNQVTLTVTKDVTGAPATGAPGSYDFSVSCANPTASYTGSVVLTGTTTSGTGTVTIPEGSTGCTVTETSTPTAPPNYTWGTATYVQPTSPIASGATATITNPLIDMRADVSVVKTLTTAGPYLVGQQVSYTITVANAGPSTATNVAVSDTPTNLSGLVFTGACTAMPCTIASIAPNASATITVTGTITADGAFSNSATATPTEADPDTTNNTGSDGDISTNVIDAVDDTMAPVNGGTGGTTPTVLANDTLNGAPVNPADVALTPGTSPNPGLVMNADGTITIAPNTPAGTYVYPYTICEVVNPTNCDTATVTVTLSPSVLVANPDAGSVISEEGGIAVPNVLANDTINGQPMTIDQVNLTVVSPASDPGITLDPATGAVNVAPGTPPGTYELVYQVCETINPANCVTAPVTVTVSGGETSMRVTKTATPRDVNVGDLVRYTVVVENTGDLPVVDATLIDTPPAGFTFVDDTLTVADADNTGRLVGRNPLSVDRIDIAVGGRATLTYVMRVGAGVRPGGYVNQAKMVDNGRDASNVATAEVQVVGDPMVDETLILGTVWDDRDADGWQDSAAVSGLKVQGGFAPSAYVAHSTTVDRGAGPQPQADASSPLLHGIALGDIAARQSDADSIDAHSVVIRQTLSSLAFTDDFVLSNDQGVTVRMNAAGDTTVEKSGDAAKSLTAAELSVERTVAQVAGGYQVDYIVRSTGVDERGIPGVRIASVEGLLIETDQYGRYHVAGVPGGPWERGRNFILKVDPATLPAGSTFTTDNPLVRRVTPGLPVRFDFGVKLPQAVIEGGRQDVELELGEVIFAPGQAEVRAQYQPVIEQMAGQVRSHGGGEVVIQANGETQSLAYERARAVQEKLVAALDPALAAAVKVTLRTDAGNPDTNLVTLGGTPLLGTFLFDTDKATVKPEFRPLVDTIAAHIEALAAQGGNTVIAVVGHADRRGSREYNQALGMRRAKAVYDAIAAKLGPAAKARLRVDIDNSLTAPTGLRNGSR